MIKRLFIIPLVLSVLSTSANDLKPLTSLQHLDYQLFKSDLIKHEYHIYIKSPTDIEAGKKYPTIYLIDGGITFPLLAAYSRYLELAGDIPPTIIVGISYGTTDWRKGNRRSIDFTAPSKERDFWGGTEKFSEMLSTELIPHIEKKLPSDPSKRILFGQSLGGQFVMFNALFKPDLFWGLIASNPALHRNLEFYNQEAVLGKSSTNLFISRARNNDKRFAEPLDRWVASHDNKTNPYQLKISWVENHNHFSVAPESLRNGLMWLFDSKNKN